MRPTISPKRRARFPRFDYRASRQWPHERTEGEGELIADAVSGAWFPKIFAVEGPFGLVDSRDGGSYDLDGAAHDMPVTALGPTPARILPR